MLTIEDLMMPRYRVLIKYPNSPFRYNEIATKKQLQKVGRIDNPINFPEIFKPTEWYMYRKVGVMPRYLKALDTDGSVIRMYGNIDWKQGIDYCYARIKDGFGGTITLTPNDKVPATKKEFEKWELELEKKIYAKE